MSLILLALTRSLWRLRRDRGFQVLAGFALLAVSSATVFYWHFEHLRPVDAFYLSATTITTVGYGDVTPKTDLGKVFTSVYALAGIGIFTAFLTLIAAQLRADALGRRARWDRRREHVHGRRSASSHTARRPVRRPPCMH
jgi:hypothetical protein